jgi:stage V sporulation protein R
MTQAAMQKDRLLFDGADWDFATLQRIHDACEEIAIGELGLDVYPNQIEVITAEQMLDAYSSTACRCFTDTGRSASISPITRRSTAAACGISPMRSSSTASPCISYLMEENTATMQTLVIAHAAFGHNHFFKNNYLFKLWTDAEGILDYLDFAKGYIARCEERYGEAAVERTLDAAHALMSHGVHRYAGKTRLDLRQEEKRQQERRLHEEQMFNDLWRTVPAGRKRDAADLDLERRRAPSPACRRRICSISSRSRRPGCSRGKAKSCASSATWRNISTRSARPR